MKRIIPVIFCAMAAVSARAQTLSPTYRQFFHNPYIINTAYGGIYDQAKVSVMWRKQWVDFENAPSMARITLLVPSSERVTWGINVYSEKEVLLNNSGVLGSMIYSVPVARNQVLRFGLSGGLGMRSLDLTEDELATADPVLAAGTAGTVYPEGNAGVLYSAGNLKIGFSLTNLFRSNNLDPDNRDRFSFSKLRNRHYSASYRFNLQPAGRVSLEPTVTYQESEDGLQDHWQVSTLFNFDDKLWTGAGYHQYNGVALFLGMTVKEQLSFSYSYEFPGKGGASRGSMSHELHVALAFGRKISPVTSRAAAIRSYNKVKPSARKPRKRSSPFPER